MLIQKILLTSLILLAHTTASINTQAADNNTPIEENTQLFPIYYGNYPEYQKIKTVFYLPIKQNLNVREKVEKICVGLSRFIFDDLPIELMKIERKNDELIAHINLVERDTIRGNTWRTGFFQGSTGAHFTEVALVLSLLQPKLETDWIDGLVFYYEGERIKAERWDHLVMLHQQLTKDEAIKLLKDD